MTFRCDTEPRHETDYRSENAAMNRLWTECDEQYGGIFTEIWRRLLITYTEEGAMIWLNSRNKNLDLAKPIDLINAGEGLRAREAAYAIENLP